jgi:hypothetical protein
MKPSSLWLEGFVLLAGSSFDEGAVVKTSQAECTELTTPRGWWCSLRWLE